MLRSVDSEWVGCALDTANGFTVFCDPNDDIEALGAPEGKEELVQTMLEALQEGIDAIAADPNAAANTENSPFADANAAATELGLTDCDGE